MYIYVYIYIHNEQQIYVNGWYPARKPIHSRQRHQKTSRADKHDTAKSTHRWTQNKLFTQTRAPSRMKTDVSRCWIGGIEFAWNKAAWGPHKEFQPASECVYFIWGIAWPLHGSMKRRRFSLRKWTIRRPGTMLAEFRGIVHAFETSSLSRLAETDYWHLLTTWEKYESVIMFLLARLQCRCLQFASRFVCTYVASFTFAPLVQYNHAGLDTDTVYSIEVLTSLYIPHCTLPAW